jgi:NgoMIV restriction enzyme
LSWDQVPNNADIDNRESLQLGAAMLESLSAHAGQALPTPPTSPGAVLEEAVRIDLARELVARDNSRHWTARRGAPVTDYSQYVHLLHLNQLVVDNPTLSVTIGQDYLIKPDVLIGLEDVPTVNGLPLLHAAVSCKWTIRSDRVQNIRHENNQMVRHRRGRQPHLVAVTAEPLPSRLAAIARGTGEVDAVYHIAYDELDIAVQASDNVRQQAAWGEITGQARLLNYNLLAQHLASW